MCGFCAKASNIGFFFCEFMGAAILGELALDGIIPTGTTIIKVWFFEKSRDKHFNFNFNRNRNFKKE